VDDATVGGEHPRTGPTPGDPGPADPVHGDPAQDPAPQDDPGARAKADVRAILAKALGLRRIVELAAEFGGAPDPARPELPRARYWRPGRRPAG
jgi:hypothetical protein